MYLSFLGEVQTNRLLPLATYAIAQRRGLAKPTQPVTMPVFKALKAIADSKFLSAEEKNDLVTIDNFFGIFLPEEADALPFDNTVTRLQCVQLAREGKVVPSPYATTPGNTCLNKFPGINDEFFYPKAAKYIWEGSRLRPDLSVAENVFWNFDSNKIWKDLKLPVQNAATATDVLNSYPWPSPSSYFKMFWLESQLSELKKFVNFGRVLLPNDVRTFITMTLIDNFASIGNRVSQFLEDKEKSAKKFAMIKAIAGLALGGLMAFALPVALATGFSVAMETASAVDKAAAAKNMANAALQMEASDSAFAQEVRRVSIELEESARRDAAKTQEVKAAEQVVAAKITAQVKSEQTSQLMKTLIPVGIGVAVLAVIGGI